MQSAEAPLPSVDVLMVTYNHASYVDQAIQSVLEQSYPGRVHVRVHVDLSDDGTEEVVQRLASVHPQILPHFHRQRAGVTHNVASALASSTADYIAWLDGDDFWLDRSKIARQVAHLEMHPKLAGVFEGVRIVREGADGFTLHRSAQPGERRVRQDFIARYPLTTQTLMFRRTACPKFPEWGHATHFADWVLALEVSRSGPFEALDEISACYRVHGSGVSGPLEPGLRMRKLVAFYALLKKATVLGEFDDELIFRSQTDFMARTLRAQVDAQADARTLVSVLGEMTRYRIRGLSAGFLLRQGAFVARSVVARQKKSVFTKLWGRDIASRNARQGREE